ncbi:hypothetical protein AA0472_1562 [Acetobacter estunensis NRIC 0472]|uniref:Uncharacterized protein n=1 Tax=Acetobacter estunensis TaxID=104097 RepID=A0A967EH44_9PROT|nr:hypothetical protein [Acetobacter estunensis]NHO53152.1 hypothetical protein [Acetobacter estunensis]GBQ24869.1 hypothetical protein AA0472_1562 [Acetobacter estunensis NRIC 0472]
MIRTRFSIQPTEMKTEPRETLFRVANLAQAHMAIHAAEESGLFPLLLSPPNTPAFMGTPWWLAMMRCLRTEGVAFADILDCGSSAGHAVAALGHGQKQILFSDRSPQTKAVHLLAASLDAQVHSFLPASCDLTGCVTLEQARKALGTLT